jgi:hypothetical protein
VPCAPVTGTGEALAPGTVGCPSRVSSEFADFSASAFSDAADALCAAIPCSRDNSRSCRLLCDAVDAYANPSSAAIRTHASRYTGQNRGLYALCRAGSLIAAAPNTS